MSRRVRLFPLLALSALAFILGGCVYLRLLQLKHQLADFDRNIEVDTRDGLALTFRHPVLLDRDVEEFFKWVPDNRQRLHQSEKWQFRWVKERTAADRDEPTVEIAIDLLFKDHRLVKLRAPESFFAATLPKPLALAALKSLGRAQIDRKQRTAQSRIDPQDIQNAVDDPFFTQQGIREALGAPVRIGGTASAPEWYYRFAPASARQQFGATGVVETTIAFDAATGRMRWMRGQTAFGTVVFDTGYLSPSSRPGPRTGS